MPCWIIDSIRRAGLVAVLTCLVWTPALPAETLREPVERAGSVEPVWRDMDVPAVLMAVPGTSAQWLYGTENGRLYLLHQGSGRAQLLRDLRLPVYGDLGLDSIALHPDFRENGRLFVLSATDTPQPLAELTEWQLRMSGGTRPELVFRHRLLTVPAASVWCVGGSLGFSDSGHLRLILGTGGRSGVDSRLPGASLRGRSVRLDIDQPRPGAPFSRAERSPEVRDGGEPIDSGQALQAAECPRPSDDGVARIHAGVRITQLARGPDGELYGYADDQAQLLRLIPPELPPLIPITTGSESD